MTFPIISIIKEQVHHKTSGNYIHNLGVALLSLELLHYFVFSHFLYINITETDLILIKVDTKDLFHILNLMFMEVLKTQNLFGILMLFSSVHLDTGYSLLLKVSTSILASEFAFNKELQY